MKIVLVRRVEAAEAVYASSQELKYIVCLWGCLLDIGISNHPPPDVLYLGI
jgi:hypothetical protein